MNATIDNTKAREILERKIEQGRASAARLLEHVQTHTPVDTIATGSALRFGTRAFDDAAQRPELVMSAGDMPAGNTVWRMSNALSWIANSTEDAERRMSLQRLAGEVVDGRRDRAEVLQ